MSIITRIKKRIFSGSYVSSDIIKIIKNKFPDTQFEPNVQIKGDINNLILGSGVIIQYGTVLHLGGMDWCENAGSISIGDGSIISPYCLIYGCGPGGVHIGKNFDCGPYVGIFASRTNYKKGPNKHIFAPVTIGDDVIIYANCIISPGVAIGDRATIAAGSVVTTDIPEGSMAGGVPAKVIRENVR